MLYAFIGIVFIYLLSLLSIGLLALPLVPYLMLAAFFPKPGQAEKGGLGGAASSQSKMFSVAFSFMLLAGCFVNPVNAGLFALFSLAPFASIVYAQKRGAAGSWCAIAAAGLIAGGAFYIALFPSEARVALERDIALSIERLYDSLGNTYAERLTDESYISRMYGERERYAALFTALVPAFAFAVSAISTYFTERVYFPKVSARVLKVPDMWLAVLGAGLFFAAAPQSLISESVRNNGYQILVAGVSLYFFRGVDIALYYLERWKFGLFFRGFFCALVLLELALTVVVAILGLLSIYKNLLPAEEKA